ncbi:glycosyltransferase family 4 protein [Cohnella faecalis]|uniref:Glycosyltransferase family 1 protein n=1 Tax=Cohnella faecalis TaxID=2315694 RepID=A0A398CPI9_9BACL|nr:glycosyltransferase family 4 protein [Cohnella faecalis]RIE04302.1 glycosyltransferase family 1 protein [Cohnella faecalis]
MKKVLVLANHEFALYNFRKEVIENIVANQYEVYLSLPYGEKVEYFKEMGCTFIDTFIDRRGANPFADMKLLLSYLRIMKQIRPDIVLTYTSKPTIYGGIICSLLKIPYIVNNSGLIILPEKLSIIKPIISLLYKLGVKRSNCIFYQNEVEQSTLNKILNRKDRYRLIPGSGVNLVDHKQCDYPSEENGLVFNYVARVMKGKGIEEYLECAKTIKGKYSNVTFNIIGFFDDESYKSIVEEYHNQGIVCYLGAKKDIRPYIEKAHAIIHTSYSEGMSNVMLEHCAMSRPCIASNIPGCKEIVDDGKNGYLFEVKNVVELTQKVEKFIKLSHKEKEKMAKSAREKVEKEFDRRNIVSSYMEEINKICEK